MSEKSCNFLGPKERPIDVGSTKAIGLVESRGGDKRLVVPKSLICMVLNLKGVTFREDVLKLVRLVTNGTPRTTSMLKVLFKQY